MNPYSTLAVTKHCPKDGVHVSKRGSSTALGNGGCSCRAVFVRAGNECAELDFKF